MTSQEILEKVAQGMVATGVYKDVKTAIQALAVEQIERKIAAYKKQVRRFEKKYNRSLEEHNRALEGKAAVEDEEEWMEWKGAVVMLDAWQRALRELLNRAS
jgi:ribulose kinase